MTNDQKIARREREKRLRAKRKAAGLCIKCSRPAESGRVRCMDHLLYQAAEGKRRTVDRRPRDKARYAARKAAGQCVHCPAPAASGHVHCEKHLKRQRMLGREYVKDAVDRGDCPSCKVRPQRPHAITCAHCAKRKKDKARWAAKKAARNGTKLVPGSIGASA